MVVEDFAFRIAYTVRVPRVRKQVRAPRMPFPLTFLAKNIPEPVTGPVAPPDQSSDVARGAYLVRMGACADCHTPQEKGQPIPGMEFAGGGLFHEPKRDRGSTNINPSPSWYGYYNEATVIQALRLG